MKILYINPLDKRYGSTYRSRNIVKALISLGHDVQYVESNLQDKIFENSLSIKQKDNLMGYFVATCDRVALTLKSDYDLLYLQKFIPLSTPCLLAAKLKGKKCIVDWDDLDFCFQENIIKKIVVFLSECVFPYFADLITTHSERLKKYAHKRWIRSVEIVNQVVDFDEANITEIEKEELREQLGAKNKKILCFLGTLTLGGAKDLDLIIRTVHSVVSKREDVFFLIIGGGPLENKFSNMLAQYGLANSSHITGLIPHQEVARFLSIADVGLIFMRNNLGNRIRVSFKVLEYLKADVSIAGNLVGETKKRFSKYCYISDLKADDPLRIIEMLSTANNYKKDSDLNEYSLSNIKSSLRRIISSLPPIITKRIDLNLGYSCNADCPFCYYKISKSSRLKDKDLTTEQAKRLIRYIKRRGKEIIDFTGGEPTIRQDIFELASYAKSLGFKELSIITNGLKLSDMSFLKRIVDSGINDFLFSMHGYNPEIHDKLVGINGAFDKLIQAIKNAKQISGVRLRSNTVINGLNFKHALQIAELLYSLGVQHVNFILFNPIVEASCADKNVNVKYSEAAPYLKGVIDNFKDKFERITIRYLPFCFLSGYEQYITECPQIQYDSFEWDYFVRMRIRNRILASSFATLVGLLLLPNIKRILSLPMHNLLRESMMRGLSFKNKVKGRVCKKCKFDYVCDGLWKEYAKTYRFHELKEQSGERISEPNRFLC